MDDSYLTKQVKKSIKNMKAREVNKMSVLVKIIVVLALLIFSPLIAIYYLCLGIASFIKLLIETLEG